MAMPLHQAFRALVGPQYQKPFVRALVDHANYFTLNPVSMATGVARGVKVNGSHFTLAEAPQQWAEGMVTQRFVHPVAGQEALDALRAWALQAKRTPGEQAFVDTIRARFATEESVDGGEFYYQGEVGLEVTRPIDAADIPATLQQPQGRPHVTLLHKVEFVALQKARATQLIATAEAAGETLGKGKAKRAARHEIAAFLQDFLATREGPKYVGAGDALADDNAVYFAIVEWQAGQDARRAVVDHINNQTNATEQMEPLGDWDFHVTLAFRHSDIHGVPKDRTTRL
jgi:hypothetical protein